MKRFLMVWLGVLLMAGSARAQDELALGKLYLGTAQCTLRSGAGSPEGSVVGKVCDVYVDTAAGLIYRKVSGTGNTGWRGDGDVRIGGTGLTSYAIGDLLYASAATTLSKLAAVATGQVLVSAGTGTAPAWSGTPSVTSLTASSFVGSTSYSSGTTGWRITSADGAGDFRYLAADEMRVKLFTADLESVLAGSQRVTKSFSTISQTFTCPSAAGGATSTLWVKDSPTFGDAAVFVSGDSVLIHSMSRTVFGPFTIEECVGVVTGYTDGSGANAGQQSWTFTRGTGTNGGLMGAGATVAVDQLVQDLGVSGNGYVETTAVDGAASVNAPYTQVVTWQSAPVSGNLTTRCRLGNLKGITTTTEYGLLCGSYSGNAYVLFSDVNAEIVGIPLILKDSGTVTVKIDPSVPSFAMGSTLPTAYGTGTGIWMGKDAGAYKFRVGDPSGNRLTYDGGLTLVSANLTIDSTGISLTPGTTYAADRAYRFTTAFGGTNNYSVNAFESGSSRSLFLQNTSTAAGTLTVGMVATASGSTSAQVFAYGDGHIEFNGTGYAVSRIPFALKTSGAAASYPLDLITSNANWAVSFQNTSSTGFGVIVIGGGSSSSYYSQSWYDYASNLLGYVDGAGTWAKNTSSTWSIISDSKSKKNITPYGGALDRIRQVKMHEYDYTGDYGQKAEHTIGVLAEEVAALFPRSVSTTPRPRAAGQVLGANTPAETLMIFNPHEMFMANIQAVIELDQQVQALRAEVDALKRKAGGQ